MFIDSVLIERDRKIQKELQRKLKGTSVKVHYQKSDMIKWDIKKKVRTKKESTNILKQRLHRK